MAIKLEGLAVITDDPELRLLYESEGKYNAFHPIVSTFTSGASNLDFDKPVQTCTMTANDTITCINQLAGRSVLFLLDRSATGYTPTWSGFVWGGGVEPTWSDYRYWTVSCVCTNSTTVFATAEGYGSTVVIETITLTGTSGSPTYVDIITSDNDFARQGLIFLSSGTIQKPAGLGGVTNTNFSSWCNTTPSQTYYIRCTYVSGDEAPDSVTSLNTWHALSSTRTFVHTDLRETISYGTETMVFKIEIASDQFGTNILDTGYYEAEFTGLA